MKEFNSEDMLLNCMLSHTDVLYSSGFDTMIRLDFCSVLRLCRSR